MTAAQDAWTTDVTDIVTRFAARGTPRNQIFVLGLPPWIIASTYPANGLFVGGAMEADFLSWNNVMSDIPDPNYDESHNCVFVPMQDVYGVNYNPYTNVSNMCYGAGPPDYSKPTCVNTHPSQFGHDAIAAAIIAALPATIKGGRLLH